MIVNYQYVDSTEQVVYCISDDGKCYVSLLVGDGHDPNSELYQQYAAWIDAGNTPLPPPQES